MSEGDQKTNSGWTRIKTATQPPEETPAGSQPLPRAAAAPASGGDGETQAGWQTVKTGSGQENTTAPQAPPASTQPADGMKPPAPHSPAPHSPAPHPPAPHPPAPHPANPIPTHSVPGSPGQPASPDGGWQAVKRQPQAVQANAAIQTVSGSGGPILTSVSTPAPPLFSRPPRVMAFPPGDEVEILEPMAMPSEQTTSLAAILLPLGGSLFGLTIAVLATALSGKAGFPVFMIISLPMMLFSVAGGVMNYKRQQKRYKEQVKERESSYQAHLAEKREKLEALAQAQRQAINEPHPGPDECVRRASERDLGLWERQPGNFDFLHLRLGMGSLPRTFKIKPPNKPNQVGKQDVLLQKADMLCQAYERIEGVAVSLPLAGVQAAGIFGPRQALVNTTRSLLVHLAAHHSPAEVKLVLVVPEGELEEWKWARWLPHVWSEGRKRRFLASNPQSACEMLLDLEETLSLRQSQDLGRSLGMKLMALPVYVFVFADPELFKGPQASRQVGPLLNMLLEQGEAVSAYSIFLADRQDGIPDRCGAIIDLSGAQGQQILLKPPSPAVTFQPDSAGREQAETFARSLAPLQPAITGARPELPTSVPFLSLFNTERVEDLPAPRAWLENRPDRSMAVPVGLRANGMPFLIDIQDGKDGPNALVAGATGSGKSEFLQSLVLSLAVHFHPHEVVFAILDFKGGDFCAPLRNLPHVVSNITNLEMEDVPRAILSLEKEVTRREGLFERARLDLGADIRSLADYNRVARQNSVFPLLPYLILIVDEFKILKDQLPNELDKFIQIALTGRSMGVRMILAAQKPDKGVISGQIAANTQVRVCLPVVDPEQSSLILDRPDAAYSTGAGRACIRIDSVNRKTSIEKFQSAYAGASYNPDAAGKRESFTIAEVALDGSRRELFSSQEANPEANKGREKQLYAVVNHLKKVAEAQGFAKLPGPWLSPLPKIVHLANVEPRDWGWDGQGWRPTPQKYAPLIGLKDNPVKQSQEPLRVDLQGKGNLLIFGSPGTAKLTVLETLLTSLVLDHSPDELHLYLMDFVGMGLTLFEPLPHVGAVVLQNEPDRLLRLLKFIQQQIEERKQLLGGGKKSMAEYRQANPQAPAEILLAINSYTGFTQAVPGSNIQLKDEYNLLMQIAREGPRFGVHVAITNDSIKGFPSPLRDSSAQQIIFQMNDVNDYTQLVGRMPKLAPAFSVEGRGLFDLRGEMPLEFQAALAGNGKTEDEQNATLEVLFQAMQDRWQGEPAPAIPPVPPVLPLSDVLEPSKTWTPALKAGFPVPLGVKLLSPQLDPFVLSLEDGPNFWLSGPSHSGKTTLVQTWLLALAELYADRDLRFYLIDVGGPNLQALKSLPHTLRYLDSVDELAKLDIRKDIEQLLRNAAGANQAEPPPLNLPAVVVAIGRFNPFRHNASKENLAGVEAMIQRKDPGTYFLIAGEADEFRNNPIATALKSCRAGLFIGAIDNTTAASSFGITLESAYASRSREAGEAIFIKDNNHLLVKLATCQEGAPEIEAWVNLVRQKKQP